MTEVIWSLNGVNAPDAQEPAVPRTLTYTGCWTCRERHVKCDERPGICGVCADAKLPCGGYDVRLIWNSEQSGRLRKQRASRRQIKLDINSYQPVTEDEVMQTITQLDRSAAKLATTTLGPFSVFSVQPPSQSASESATPDSRVETIESGEVSLIEETRDGCDDLGLQHQSDSPVYEIERQCTITDDMPESPIISRITDLDMLSDFPSSSTDSPDSRASYSEQYPLGRSFQNLINESLAEMPLYDNAISHDGRDAIGASGLGSFGPQNINLVSVEMDDASPQTARLSERTSHWPNSPLNVTESLSRSRYLMGIDYNLSATIVGNKTGAMLMHHYMKHMIHLMQPVFHQKNPFITIYLPLAIEGSPSLEVSSHLAPIYSASATVFHSLMSMAAVHLQSLQSGEDGLQQLARHHKQRALVALRSALTTQSSNYRNLMTAILSMVSADIMDGGTSDHWIHLEAAVQLRASRHYSSLVSQETRQLNSIGRMLHLFAQTAQPRLEPKPWPGLDEFSSDSDSDPLEPSIEFIYGITTFIAGAILRIYRITQYIAYYKGQEYPEALMQACETLGDELCSWSIHVEPFSAIDPKQEHTLKVARAQARAFYYASLIYYYRSVQNCQRKSLHLEQQAAISAMNEAEDLKLLLGDDSSLPAPITWPAFIASCEAVGDDRQEWDKWWNRVQKYRMGNYTKQQSIVRRVWAHLDSNNTSVDWRDSLAAMDLRIIPV
ncbi:hypothetical protein V494_02551 [Pseudogymnoascus sp. VKM F-4513 (FW-928)]|nr:hypothetical protein V494_02551 [Pseudogymnoascus sp. VKM F-4513 (FW-928)]